jgi:hypothetical protein
MLNIPKQYSHFAFGIIQSGLTCAIAAAIASIPFLSDGTFAIHWLKALLLSWAIMLPVVVIAAPVIRRLVNILTR